MISLKPYRDLLTRREVAYLFAASALGRLPIGMTGLAILLLVQGTSGSFASGGAAAGCFVAGLACAAPALGRIVDRRGPRSTLLACALLFPASLCALVAAVSSGASALLVVACAAAAGASFPPITVCMRTYLRQQHGDEASLTIAYSLDSVLIELMFIVGPMLVALFVAYASASAAVGFAAACGVVGVLLFLRASALRNWRIAPRATSTLLGPLGEPRFVALIALVVCYSIAFGLLEAGLPAYAAEAGRPALAGVLLGLMSIGSALGGLAYGSRGWRGPLMRQFSLMLGLMGIGLALLAAPWSVPAFAALSFVAGVVMAPTLIIQSMLVATRARAEHTAEAFTWSTSALLTGVAIGLTLGGALVEAWRSPAALATAGAVALVASAAAGLLARR
jgi:MFS family permease